MCAKKKKTYTLSITPVSLYDNKYILIVIPNTGCTKQEVATGMCTAKQVGVDRFSDSLLSENLYCNKQ